MDLRAPDGANRDPKWVSNPESVEIGLLLSGAASVVPTSAPTEAKAASILPSGSADATAFVYVTFTSTAGVWLPSNVAIEVDGTATSGMMASLPSLLSGIGITGTEVPRRAIPSSGLTVDVTPNAGIETQLTAEVTHVTDAGVITSAAILLDAIIEQARVLADQPTKSIRGPTSVQIQRAVRTLIANSDVGLTFSQSDGVDVSLDAELPGRLSGLSADGSLTLTRLIAAYYAAAGANLETSTTCVPG
jgi:hypothetical protein